MPDRNRKIVIFVDDASMRRAIERILLTDGYEADWYESAESIFEVDEAITAAAPVRPVQEENAMLVLSRKRGEQITIGPDIELTVVDIRGSKVRLAFDAPRDVSIYRQEIYRRIQDESRHEAQRNERTRDG